MAPSDHFRALSPPMDLSSSNRAHNASDLSNEDHSILSELDWPQLVRAEVIAVTSAMRKNARWSSMSASGLNMGRLGISMGLRNSRSHPGNNNTRDDRHPLLTKFTLLREYLDSMEDTKNLDAKALLEPFLEVISSGNTTGPIVETALSSVEKFLHYGIIGLHNENIAVAMNALSTAATHCKYEASDPKQDELVLLKMLQVLQVALTSQCGQVLSDESVCNMMETGLSMCYQMRLSDMLRRSAKHVVTKMIMSIFQRLKSLEEEWQLVNPPLDTDENLLKTALHMRTPQPHDSPVNVEAHQKDNIKHSVTEADNSQTDETKFDTALDKIAQPEADQTVPVATGAEEILNTTNFPMFEENEDNEETMVSSSYGLPAVRELLRVLVLLLNPEDHKLTDSMRLIALDFLTVALEIGGKSISRFDALRKQVADELCRYLFQLAKTDSLPLLSQTLRTIATVFATFRPHLKLQQELFLSFLIERLLPFTGSAIRDVNFEVDTEGNIGLAANNKGNSDQSGAMFFETRSASPSILGKQSERESKNYSDQLESQGDVREALLESLLQCVGSPAFMIDLWFNYDCDLSCRDIYEDLIQFISRYVFPTAGVYPMQTSNVLCLDTLLTITGFMVSRLRNKDSLEDDYVELSSSEELLKYKAKKRIILKGVHLFNETPKKGIKFLQDQDIVKTDETDTDKPSLSRFLMSTQLFNKKSLGEYLSRPENLELLDDFMHQFDFKGKPLDEALRAILETFRLPGESQQILRVIETFAKAYFETKPREEGIANLQAAEVLAYSIIMLNTDQHNPQVKRRMTLDQYAANLRGVNDNANFPQQYLEDIYNRTKENEILMPEEHEGYMGFNYAWKQLLQRSHTAGRFDEYNIPTYDKAIFEQTWKPAVAAIAYAFSAAEDDATLQKAITGFDHHAELASYYELHDVFDCIIVNLATMTGLIGNEEKKGTTTDPIVDVAGQKYVVSRLAIKFGSDYKAQLAAVVVFTIIQRHGSSLRKGWNKILQIIRNLFINSLLPSSMLKVEDFLTGTTSILLKPRNTAELRQQERRDGSLLSTLSYFLLSPYSNDQSYRADPTKEEVENTMCAVDCVVACKLEELFADISSLNSDSLKSLMSAITSIGYDLKAVQDAKEPLAYDPTAVLFLEFMISTVVRNSARIDFLWPYASRYIFGILENAEKQHIMVVVRNVVGLLRLCICIAPKPDMHGEILKSLCLLRDLPPTVMQAVVEQMMAGISKLSLELKLTADENSDSQSTSQVELVKTILEIQQKVGSSL